MSSTPPLVCRCGSTEQGNGHCARGHWLRGNTGAVKQRPPLSPELAAHRQSVVDRWQRIYGGAEHIAPGTAFIIDAIADHEVFYREQLASRRKDASAKAARAAGQILKLISSLPEPPAGGAVAVFAPGIGKLSGDDLADLHALITREAAGDGLTEIESKLLGVLRRVMRGKLDLAPSDNSGATGLPPGQDVPVCPSSKPTHSAEIPAPGSTAASDVGLGHTNARPDGKLPSPDPPAPPTQSSADSGSTAEVREETDEELKARAPSVWRFLHRNDPEERKKRSDALMAEMAESLRREGGY